MPINFDELKGFIVQQKWTDFGVVSIDNLRIALSSHEGVFEKWVKQGFSADLNYLSDMQKDRFHPEKKLPDIKSIIVLQAWYGSCDRGGQGTIARYARGRDYHKVLKKKLVVLSEWLKNQESGVETYLSVDSGPTVDRVLAESAGLGFFGKNSNLIDPRQGSYFFIASLMINQPIPETEKRRMPNCGDCTKCTKACPTGAIAAPGTIDARRCIAYLTIENKGGIPIEFRKNIGNRLFGCDICQEVCPFNEGRAGGQSIQIEELKAENGVGDTLDLKEVLSIETNEAFLERFAGTPLMRAGRLGLLRNACVVAGNNADMSLIPYLEKLTEHEDEMIKEHATWAIQQLVLQSR